MPFTRADFTPGFCRSIIAQHGTRINAARAIASQCRNVNASVPSHKTVVEWLLFGEQGLTRGVKRNVVPPSAPEPAIPEDPMVHFPDAKMQNVDWEAVLVRHGAITAERNAEELKQRHATIDLSQHGDSPVCIMQMSDVHIGSPQCDVATLIRHIKLLKSIPNLYAILDGDMLEWAISNRQLDAVLGQVGSPQEQVRVFGAMLSDLAEKCVAFVTGNHDERGFRMGGVDVFEFLVSAVKRHGIYLRDGGVLRIKLAGDVEYTWRVSHGDGLGGHSMYSNTAAMARNARHEVGHCDVASAGHTHSPEVKIVFEPRAHGAAKEQTIFLRSGSYKVLGDEQYPDRMGYWTTPFAAMPAVVFWPHRKLAVPFFCVEQAVEYLRALGGNTPKPRGKNLSTKHTAPKAA